MLIPILDTFSTIGRGTNEAIQRPRNGKLNDQRIREWEMKEKSLSRRVACIQVDITDDGKKNVAPKG